MVRKYASSQIKKDIKESFEKRFKEMLGSEEYNKFISSIITPQRKSFRINTLKEKNPKTLIKNLKQKGLLLTPVPWSENSFFVEYQEDIRNDLGNLFEHFLGKIYVQEATSMCPSILLDIPSEINKDFKVLDMAAAPGSKTTQLGILMKNKGTLIANELDYKRLGPLKINLERTGLTNIIISHADARNIEGENLYDRILLDAPCSGSGVIRKSPKTLKFYNPKKLNQLQNIQLSLLQKASKLLKPGGIMTYSTCSLDPEENEFCIEKFLENEPNMKLEVAELPGLILKNKLNSFNGVKINEDILNKTIRIWPHENDTNGFYIAKLRKIN